MKSTVIRITPETHSILHKISDQVGESMQSIIAKAVELYRRKYFLLEANRAFAAMRKDSKAWKEELKEREAWDETLLDGLEEE